MNETTTDENRHAVGGSALQAVVSDPVHNPRHYTSHPSGVECITVTEHMGFCLGNAIKYLFRREHKGTPVEDLKKAAWYISREIDRRSAESWATWPKDPRYEVSSAGRVRRSPDGQVRKLVQIPNGYLTFGTALRGKHYTNYIHRAVVETFFGEIPEGMQVCHRDGNPSNNHVTNLRVGSAKSNHADKVRHGTRNWGARNGKANLDADDVVQIRQSSATEESLASEFGVTRATIGRIRRGEAWVDRKHDCDIAFEEYLHHEQPSDVKSALESIWRADLKNDAIEDLEKARWYIEREIAKRKAVIGR